LRGSYLEPIVNKAGKFGYYAHKYDKTLFDIPCVRSLAKLYGVRVDNKKIFSGRIVPQVDFKNNEYIVRNKKIYAERLIGGNAINRFLFRITQRITVYGLFALFLISLPFILKSKDKKQEAQNAILTTSCTVGSIGFFGTLLGKLGPAGSLAGMGYGAVFAKRINENSNQKASSESCRSIYFHQKLISLKELLCSR